MNLKQLPSKNSLVSLARLHLSFEMNRDLSNYSDRICVLESCVHDTGNRAYKNSVTEPLFFSKTFSLNKTFHRKKELWNFKSFCADRIIYDTYRDKYNTLIDTPESQEPSNRMARSILVNHFSKLQMLARAFDRIITTAVRFSKRIIFILSNTERTLKLTASSLFNKNFKLHELLQSPVSDKDRKVLSRI